MKKLLNEIEKEGGFEIHRDGHLIMLFTDEYVIRMLGRELTEVIDRGAFDSVMEDKVLLKFKGIPSSIHDVYELIDQIKK